jgi:hypothetical protein
MSFAFNASALAFGARFEQPDNSIIPSQGSVALAPTGGDGYETVRNFNYKGIITFDEASVNVSGSEHGTVRNTLATVTIRNLNVLNLLHADLLSSRVTSSHEAGKDEGQITFYGTSVENLRIAGKPVQVNFNHDFYSRYSTHKTLSEALAKPGAENVPGMQQLIEQDAQKCDCSPAESRKKTLAQLLADRFGWDPMECGEGAPGEPKTRTIHCSLVDSIDGIDVIDDKKLEDDDLRAHHPVRRQGYVIKVAEFGTIKIGELIIKPGERRLNLVRFDLGCPYVGSATGASVMTNGTDMFP